MNFISICSGIEAASVAFGPLGWKAIAFSEIEPFPCAVLAHHYPEVQNFGDMSKFKEWPDLDVDVVVGGTPCQSFSVAGLRKGLEDPRGNLMLTFLGIIDKYKPKFVLWENVPGVISSNKGADFVLFLDGLEELGYIADVDIHDAQYFGVAQRRRRVFVCAQSRDFLLSSRTISSALTISQCLAEILVLILAVAKSRSATGLRGLAFDATKPLDSLQRRMRLFSLQEEGAALTLQSNLDVIRESFVSAQDGSEYKAGKNGQEDSKTSADTKCQKLTAETEAWREECLSTEPSLRSTLEEVLMIASECITSTSTNEITESKIFTCAKALLSIAAPITQSMQSSPSFWSAALSILTALKEFTNYARSTNSGLFAEVEWVHNWDDFIRQADRASESFSGFRARQYSKEVFPIAAGLQRNFAPSREAGEGAAAGAGAGAAVGFQSSQSGVRLVDTHATLDANNGPRRHNGVITMAHGQGGAEIGFDCGPTLTCNHEAPIAAYAVRTANTNANGHGTPLVPVGVTIHGTDPTVQKVASYDDIAQCLRARTPGNIDNSSTTVVQQPIVVHGTQDPCHDEHVAFALGRNGGQENAIAFAENSRAEVRLEGGDGQRTGSLSTGGGKPGQGVPMAAVSVSLRGRDGGATAELGDEVGNCLRASGGGGDKAHVLAPVSDTLYNKGIVTLKEGNASTQETDPGALLRTLRKEVGEEAFAKWGLGILDSLQQAEVLRQALHGFSIRPAAFSRSWVVYCALSRSESRSGWLLQSLREAGCERCASQGWEPSEQLAGELGAYLSELSQPGAQASRFMRDLWWAAQGSGLLREALSAVQEVGRPTHGQRKPVHAGAEGFGAAGAEGLQGAGLHREIPRDGLLQQACAASEAGDSGCSATEQERGGQSRLGQTPFAVRRLTCEEAEFLQGFPRGYTKIPWRKKPASDCPDGPRYRALGNSWAVPNVRWIGRRIDAQLRACAGSISKPLVTEEA